MIHEEAHRSRRDQMIAGICGGLGEVFSIDSTIIRLAVVFVGAATGIVPMVAACIVGWIIIPVAPPQYEK